MMLEPSVASGVARAALTWFERSSICQKKISPSEWTVLAGIVLQSHKDEGDGTFRMLSVATGNKCLGRRDLNPDGLVVNDCHAEVLARRSFLRYLYAEALAWQVQENDEHFKSQSLFERHPETRRLVLKSQHSLHLFISEAPCGDAAIYELRDEVVDELVQQRTAREAENGQKEGQVERSSLRLTGAKSHGKRSRIAEGDESQSTPPDKRFAQAVGVARVKSGRSDLPPEKQTLSMSCSDKLAKWNALGLQGSLLLQWFEPIILNSIVVSEDKLAMSVTKQEEALRRALSVRLKERNLPSCKTSVVTNAPLFNRQRAPNKTPSSLALNWTLQESYWPQASARDSLNDKPVDVANFVAKFFSNFGFEFLMAASGFKQGAKKASKMDRRATEKVASRLAKRNLLHAFCHVIEQNQEVVPSTVKELEYLQLKLAVPLRTPSDAASPVPSTSRDVAATDRRKAFSDWVGTPAAFKRFKL